MQASHLVRVALVVGFFHAVGCADSSPTRATPPDTPVDTPRVPAPGSAPAAAFTLTVDDLGSQDAVTGVSEVRVNASASTGSSLRYRVEFGDGASANEAVVKHVYEAAGTYAVTLTLTDDTGRTVTTSRRLVVASPLGTWMYNSYLARSERVEVSTLTLTARDGMVVRGVLARAGELESAVTGSLTRDRRIRLVADRQGEAFEGVLPSVMTGDRAIVELAVRGGPADGETLAFRPRIGEPSGAPPDAVLKMRFFSFSAPFAVKQVSPILFDASTSRGEGLTYYIEFGDGQFATDAVAVHPIEEARYGWEGTSYTARLTVADRFGRFDSETIPYKVRSLVINGYYQWWQVERVATGHIPILQITSQEGTQITGKAVGQAYPSEPSFTGTVSPEGEVRLSFIGSDVMLVGTLSFSPTAGYGLRLTIVGGPYNGLAGTYHERWGY